MPTQRMNVVEPSDGPEPSGLAILRDPARSKGLSFTEPERDALGLHGFLPPRPQSMAEEVERVMWNYQSKQTPLEKYVYLTGLQNRNETLFFRVVIDHLEEMMPVIYTPTVGLACQEYGRVFQEPRGLFITVEDRGRIAGILRRWPERDVRIIVVTDGERILGLGDLGAHGMGIPVGKLSLYVACAGVPPHQCMPVTLDVGTKREELRADPFYLGLRRPRLQGPEYDEFVDEFIQATQQVFPGVLVQFEDFGNDNAFRLLAKYRDRICTFNDDIQGTGGVALAGLYSALRITGGRIRDQVILFLGAGEAATGIADLVVSAMVEDGCAESEARQRCWCVDSKGLVVKSRQDLADHKRPYAHDHEPVASFLDAIQSLRPTAIIGVSGQTGAFGPPVLEAMARLNDRPIIFALSNPTSKAECTAEQAYAGTDGRAVFASGSPFGPVVYRGRTLVPGQCNNAYVFPGVGLGALVCGATRVTDEMFSAAAKALAREVSEQDLAQGRTYPPIAQIRNASAAIAAAVAEVAYARGFARVPRPKDMMAFVRSRMYEPAYGDYA